MMKFIETLMRDLDVTKTPTRYHGDTVRALFMVGAISMLIALPFFAHLLPLPFYYSELSIILIGFFAGLTNRYKRVVMIGNMIIAAVSTVVFEYYGYLTFISPHKDWHQTGLFLINQSLAVIFFIAFYYSVKTLRNMIWRPTNE